MQGYIDGGILNTQEELESWLSEQTDGHFLYSKDPFNFKVRDPFNSKIITVTATYFIASNLAKHVELNELNTPFARKKYAKVTGIVKNSLKPLVDPIDFDVKEKLYTSVLTYREADVKFEATEYEQEYNILHCYLYVIFKNIAERIIAEVDINPRV